MVSTRRAAQLGLTAAGLFLMTSLGILAIGATGQDVNLTTTSKLLSARGQDAVESLATDKFAPMAYTQAVGSPQGQPR